MLLENKSLNLPDVYVTDAMTDLAELYTDAIAEGVPLRSLPTPMLWGPPGIGKSEGVRQFGDMLEEGTGKRVVIIDVRLQYFNPVDLRGIPVPDTEKTLAVWLKPKILDMDESSDTINILFLDEISAAPQTVQAAAYQICLDRQVGEHRFPDNCIVIAAGNRTTDQSISYKMSMALCNRLMHLNICTDVASWRDWAVRNGIDPRVVGYISFDNSRLCVEPEAGDKAYPTPRTWTYVSNILKTMKRRELSRLHTFISGCVGMDAAVDFVTWCGVCDKLPSVEYILDGSWTAYPDTHDALYALIASLIAAINSRGDDITDEELKNVCDYAKRFPADFAESFFGDLKKVEPVRQKLMKMNKRSL